MQRPMKIDRVQRDGADRLSIQIGQREVLLDGKGIESFLKRLSLYRSAMKPRVADTMSPTHRYLIEVNPSWHADPHPEGDGLVTLFRHSGYGWTGFFLRGDRLDALHGEFRRYLAQATPEPVLLPN
jgi:hypothetical protein